MSRRGRVRAAYCIRADGGRYAEAFRAGEYAVIGGEQVGDLSGIPRDDTAALSAAYDSAYPGDGKTRRGSHAGWKGWSPWRNEGGLAPCRNTKRSSCLTSRRKLAGRHAEKG